MWVCQLICVLALIGYVRACSSIPIQYIPTSPWKLVISLLSVCFWRSGETAVNRQSKPIKEPSTQSPTDMLLGNFSKENKSPSQQFQSRSLNTELTSTWTNRRKCNMVKSGWYLVCICNCFIWPKDPLALKIGSKVGWGEKDILFELAQNRTCLWAMYDFLLSWTGRPILTTLGRTDRYFQAMFRPNVLLNSVRVCSS